MQTFNRKKVLKNHFFSQFILNVEIYSLTLWKEHKSFNICTIISP